MRRITRINFRAPLIFALMLGLALPGTASGADEDAPPSAGQAKLNEAIALLDQDPNLLTAQTQIEEALKAALAADANLTEARYDLGVLYFRLKRYDEAKTEFEAILRADPKMADSLAMLGGIMEAKGKPAEASTYFDQSLALDRTNPIANNYLAARDLSGQQWPDAISHARQALVEHPDNMNSYLNLAIAYYNMKLLDLARFVCLNALSIDAKNAPMHNMLGLILLEQEDVRGALVQFNNALKADPNLVDALMNAGAVTLSYSDFQTAFDRFDAVTRLAPNNEEAKLSRAVALRGLERFDEAKAAYGEIVAADANNEKANYNLCILYNEYMTDYKAALDQCQRYYDIIPGDHPEKERMRQRIEGIKQTIEALGATGG